ACASNDKTPSSVVLSDDNRCPQTLQSGQQLIVSLPSNPATGYRWILHEAAAEQLHSLGPEVFSNPKGDMIGGDGLSTWRFEAQEPGSGRLYLTYQRPWEVDAEPAGMFDCRIEVR
ncbi:MAG TPA: peptidase inhibitor I42, partial [Pseudomonas sp.]|nr:peptidase inhibitor I42 [Pseudomonas sp.]